MGYCGEHTAVKGNVDVRCKAWTCPECADGRKRQLIAQGIGGTPNKFLTLTTRRVEGMTPEEAAFDKIMKGVGPANAALRKRANWW